MINKRIAISGMSILAASGMMAAGALAVFSDSAQSTGNTFTTGNADVVIAEDAQPGDPGTYANSITGVNFSGLAPGSNTEKDFWLKNNSTANIGMDFTADLQNLSDTGGDGSLNDKLLVKFTCDADNNGFGGSDTVTGEFTVHQWIDNAPVSIGSRGQSQGASNATNASDQDELLCKMSARVSDTAGAEISGESVSFDGIFNGAQVNVTPTVTPTLTPTVTPIPTPT